MGSPVVHRRPVGFVPGKHELAVDFGQAPSWASVSKAINRLVTERDGQWCGVPMPLPGLGLVVADGHPMAEQIYELQRIVDGDRPPKEGPEAVVESLMWEVANEWRGFHTNGIAGRVLILRDRRDGKATVGFVPSAPRRNRFIFGPFETMDAWDLDAEITAVEKLATLLSERMFKSYVLTGQFLERSKRSGVAYIFRRLRPTIALRTGKANYFLDAGDGEFLDAGDGEASILACLCLHPLAYYEGSFCGAMVPTDDVIAHLLLMRGDEHLFWKRANQHHPLDPESGL